MKLLAHILVIATFFLFHFFSNAQMKEKEYNYTSFTNSSVAKITDEMKQLIPLELQSHPEFGILPYGAPCDDCFELLQKRKDSSRVFVKNGSNGTVTYTQAILGTYNFEKNGQMISFDPRLKLHSPKIYRSDKQEAPTVLNINERYSAFEVAGQELKFNNKIVLILEKNDGSIDNLGEANWSDYTVGDEGIYIKNAWQGIDITISYGRNSIKLNYIIPAPLSYLQNVKNILFSDNLQLPSNYTVIQENPSNNTPNGYIGKYIVRNQLSQDILEIGKAYGYDYSEIKENHHDFVYRLDGNKLSIVVPTTFTNQTSYPLIIDPLVSFVPYYYAGTMNFFRNGLFCAGNSGTCDYNLSVPVPLNATITDALFNMRYHTNNPGWLNEAGVKINGPCGTSPSGASFWSCTGSNPGTCTGTNLSMYTENSFCITPTCVSQLVTYTIRNSYCNSPASCNSCGGSCHYMPNNTFSVQLIGRTVEPNPPVVNLSPAPCSGTVTLTGQGQYGMPGYSYSWNTGATTQSIIVANAGTYTATITDACNQTTTQTFNINCPLSIDLTNYEVQKAGEKALISWVTEKEINNAYFTIERMTDTKIWEIIGTINGKKNSNVPISYQFYDDNTYKKGVSYYRLKQTDMDGVSTYYEVKSLDFSTADEILIYPQPANEELTIEWKNFKGEITFTNINGLAIHVPYTKTDGKYVFRTSNLSKGIYFVSFIYSDETLAIRKISIN